MYVTKINLVLLIFIATAKQSKGLGGSRTNEGASTSKTSDAQQLTDDERCVIDTYAEGIISTVIAEHSGDADIQFIVENSLDELLLNFGYFRRVMKKIQFGDNYDADGEDGTILPNYRQRLDYLKFRISEKFAEFMIDACSDNFSKKMDLIYFKLSKSFSLVKITEIKSEQCLPQDLPPKKRKGYTIMEDRLLINVLGDGDKNNKRRRVPSLVERIVDNDLDGIETTRHFIIPPLLIQRFYERWYYSTRNLGLGAQICTITRKLELWLKKLRRTEYVPEYDLGNEFRSTFPQLDRIVRALLHWSPSGNTFMGPISEQRGPFDPRFNRQDEYGMYAFETNAVTIIGRERYEELQILFGRLVEYVNANINLSTDFERSFTGTQLITSMLLAFMGHDETLMDINQWVRRELTEEELEMLPVGIRDEYRGKKFWAIRENHDQKKRSIELDEKKDCHSIEELSKSKWGDFIIYLMTAFMLPQRDRETVTWYCDFVRLFTAFRFEIPNKCSDNNFDTFLMSKIANTTEWQECLSFDEIIGSQEWCRAWRRILLNSNLGSNATWKISQPAQFHKDLKTMIDWLLEKVFNENTSKGHNVVSESIVCYQDTTLLSCPNSCSSGFFNVKSARAKREIIPEKTEILYEREWFKDTDNNMKCLCSDDKLKNTTARTEESINRLNHLLNSGSSWFGNLCDKNSPQHDSERCTNLRRKRNID